MTTERPTRLLVAGLSWPPETFLARLIRGLLDSGIEVTVAGGRKPDATWLSLPGFSWLRLVNDDDSLPTRLLTTGGQYGRALIAGRDDLRRFRAQSTSTNGHGANGHAAALPTRLLPFAGRRWDVIYFPWNAGAISFLPLFALAPAIVSCRGAQVNVAPHNPERSAIRDGLRETFERAAAVHCVSEAILAEATQYGLDPAKAVVIRPAVDPTFFRPADDAPAPHAEFHLITTGSLIWRKGLEYMLAAARLLRERGVPVRLEIIGDGPERQHLNYTIVDMDLGDCVELSGKLAPADVRARLQTADAFVFSSLSEGISNAVLEAMACGLPVVSTNCGGMPEAVTDGVEGYLVPTRDPEALATALAALWTDAEARQRMGAAGRERVLRDFRLESQVSRFASLVREVARPHQVARAQELAQSPEVAR